MAETSLTVSDIETLKKPFDEKTIGIKIQSLSKNKDKALLVAYVQHTDAYDRLESVDPAWSCQVMTIKESADGNIAISMRMTVKGVTRENAGEGEDYKSAYSDAIKRVAMLFGVGRYLYDQGQAWVPYNDAKDKYRAWTLQEFNQALRGEKLPTSSGQAPKPTPKPIETQPTKQSLAKEIFATAEQLKLSQADLAKWVREDYKKAPDKLSVEEMKELLAALGNELGRSGELR